MWTADKFDKNEAVFLDFGEKIDITGFILVTKTIFKVAIETSDDGIMYSPKLVSIYCVFALEVSRTFLLFRFCLKGQICFGQTNLPLMKSGSSRQMFLKQDILKYFLTKKSKSAFPYHPLCENY